VAVQGDWATVMRVPAGSSLCFCDEMKNMIPLVCLKKLNQLNFFYIYICLYVQQIKSYIRAS
jgi:hypothetical protein